MDFPDNPIPEGVPLHVNVSAAGLQVAAVEELAHGQQGKHVRVQLCGGGGEEHGTGLRGVLQR